MARQKERDDAELDRRRKLQASGRMVEAPAQMSMGQWVRFYTSKLISYGHRLEDIGNYTLGQFSDFLDEMEKLEAQIRMAHIVDSAFAAHPGDGKALEKHLDSLQSTARGE